MIIDNDPSITRYVSVPKDMSQLSCSSFTAGIVEAVLDGLGFVCDLFTIISLTHIPHRTNSSIACTCNRTQYPTRPIPKPHDYPYQTRKVCPRTGGRLQAIIHLSPFRDLQLYYYYFLRFCQKDLVRRRRELLEEHIHICYYCNTVAKAREWNALFFLLFLAKTVAVCHKVRVHEPACEGTCDPLKLFLLIY